MMSGFFDRGGRHIGQRAWFALHQEETVVARSTVDGVVVTTAWTGLDHRTQPSGAPLIFETVIAAGTYGDVSFDFPSMATAIVGHSRIVEALRAGLDPLDAMCAAVPSGVPAGQGPVACLPEPPDPAGLLDSLYDGDLVSVARMLYPGVTFGGEQ